jgi:hypothetical protein
MPSTVSDVLFSEPSGRPTTLVQFAGAVVFLSLAVYMVTVGNASQSRWVLVMMAGFALSGSAESLPKNRRRLAGVLRLTAITILLGLVAVSLLAPGFVLG